MKRARWPLVSVGVLAASVLGVRYGAMAYWNHRVRGYEHGKTLYRERCGG